jgi:hypothetical protein
MCGVEVMCGVEDMCEYNTEHARYRYHCASAAAASAANYYNIVIF